MLFKKSLLTGAGLIIGGLGVASANTADCPRIPLNELSTAACSTKQAPYITGKLAKVKFYATTPCPGGAVGLRKWLQSFKGGKEYTAQSETSNPGEVSCTYKLDESWKKALNTTDAELILSASLPTRAHVNYLEVAFVGLKCPVLTFPLAKAGTIVSEKKNDPKLTYTFTAQELKGGTALGRLKNFAGKTPQVPDLHGKMTITKNFTMTCKYIYHPSKVETVLELEGSSNLGK